MKIYFYLLNNENLLLFIFLVINNNIISPNSAFCFAGWCFVLSTDTMTSLTTGRIINLKYYTLYTTIPLNTVQGSFSYKEGWLQQFFKMLLLWQDPLYEAKVMKCKTWSSDLIWLISWFQAYQWRGGGASSISIPPPSEMKSGHSPIWKNHSPPSEADPPDFFKFNFLHYFIYFESILYNLYCVRYLVP